MIGLDVVEIDEINNILTDLNTQIVMNQINVLFGFSQGGNVVDCYLRLYHDLIKCVVFLR